MTLTIADAVVGPIVMMVGWQYGLWLMLLAIAVECPIIRALHRHSR